MTPETVITLVAAQDGALTRAIENQAADIVKAAGVEGVRTDVLAPGRAMDMVIRENNAELTGILRQKFQNIIGFDIFVQPLTAHRQKRLLLADMDATMIEGETLDDLAGYLNLKDQIAPITARAMQGEIDFAEALRMRVALLAGMPVSALTEALAAIRYSRGAGTLVKTMNRHGGKCVLISGGFDMFTSRVAQTLGFYKNFGNRLGIDNDRLTGEVLPPIVDKDVKKRTLESEAKTLGLQISQTMAVGDGANDIPMLQAAGAGVGYFGKPAVVAATPYQVRYSDLTALLFMQGYRAEQFARA